MDSFIDYHSVGHEPADVQVEHFKKINKISRHIYFQVEGIKSTLSSKNIQLSNMLCLSRDNPNVMKRVFKLLEELVKESNNPKPVDAPCFLHPTHTSFKKGVKALLGNLHGYFKTSTARRADRWRSGRSWQRHSRIS